MTEATEVLAALERATVDDEPVALATIVGVRGSTYRREGARMLVRASGPPVGTVSGGCLERDVETVGREVLADGTPRLVGFDLTAEDEAVWGWGLGCNGAIELLVEPGRRAAAVAATLRTAVEREQPLAAVVLVDAGDTAAPVGARVVVHAGGTVDGDLGEPQLQAAAVDAARAALADERSTTVAGPGGARLFVEVLVPPPRLVVCGAGHDAIPMVAAARAVGWRTAVVDERASLLTSERFPEADRLLPVDRPGDAATVVAPDRRTFVVVMSHQYLQDLEYLRSFAASDHAYLGLLGPAARRERLLDDLAKQDVRLDDRRLFGPAGLDVGADGPEQIACAVVAEALAVHHGRSGGHLRARRGPIHDRAAAPTPAPS